MDKVAVSLCPHCTNEKAAGRQGSRGDLVFPGFLRARLGNGRQREERPSLTVPEPVVDVARGGSIEVRFGV